MTEILKNYTYNMIFIFVQSFRTQRGKTGISHSQKTDIFRETEIFNENVAFTKFLYHYFHTVILEQKGFRSK